MAEAAKAQGVAATLFNERSSLKIYGQNSKTWEECEEHYNKSLSKLGNAIMALANTFDMVTFPIYTCIHILSTLIAVTKTPCSTQNISLFITA